MRRDPAHPDREPGPNDDLWAGVIIGLFGGATIALILMELVR